MSPLEHINALRVRDLNGAPLRLERAYVLYWMSAFRRPHFNFALQHATGWAARLQKPLLVFEGLRCDYRWASVRHHRFIIEGMSDNARAFAAAGVRYFPYLERVPGEGKGLLQRLARNAALVVGDDFPCFFLPQMLAAAASCLDVRLDAVDSNGILPLRSTDRCFETAYSFRRHLQRELSQHLLEMPRPTPLGEVQLPPSPALPTEITGRWPPLQLGATINLASLSIDQRVEAAPWRGGWRAARARWRAFREAELVHYRDGSDRDPRSGGSGLSPYLHFGHISAHEMLRDVLEDAQWTPLRLDPRPRGARLGFWGLPPTCETFVDQLCTWRELVFNRTVTDSHYDQYESLPSWARRSLDSRAHEPRPHLYSLEQFEAGATHDSLWNAAQHQLLREGRIHNYLRMLWGKKILHWSRSPQEALAIMLELNNRYALDGRDPNSYSGIFWILGRYDRPWGPARPIFGTVRYMSCESTSRKLRVAPYVAHYGGATPP